MLCHQITRVVFPGELEQLELPGADLLLDPQIGGSEVADPSQALSLADTTGSGGIRVDLYLGRESEIGENGLDPHSFSGGFGHRSQLRLTG